MQAPTTHDLSATLAVSTVFANPLVGAVAGPSLPEVLASPAAERLEGGLRGLHRDAVKGAELVPPLPDTALTPR